MCGIAGIHRLTDAPVPRYGKLANELLLGIENRGQDSTGYLALLDSGKAQTQRAPVRATVFVKQRQAFNEDARTLLLHTRYPTVGRVNELNAQPQIAGTMAAVHNGTISNADALFQTFDLKRHAEVDSEIVPALIDLAGWENADEALNLMRGGAAVAVVDATRPRELLLARTRTYPLIWMATDDLLVWASTERAIVEAWHMTYRRPPSKKATWGSLGEFTLVRVGGGEMIPEGLTVPEPEPWQRVVPRTPSPKQSKKGQARRARKAAKKSKLAKGAERRSKGTGGTTPAPSMGVRENGSQGVLWPRTRDPWDGDPVRDVMRWTGMSYVEAYEAVYGEDLDGSSEAWEDQLWREMDDELSRMMAEERGR